MEKKGERGNKVAGRVGTLIRFHQTTISLPAFDEAGDPPRMEQVYDDTG